MGRSCSNTTIKLLSGEKEKMNPLKIVARAIASILGGNNRDKHESFQREEELEKYDELLDRKEEMKRRMEMMERRHHY